MCRNRAPVAHFRPLPRDRDGRCPDARGASSASATEKRLRETITKLKETIANQKAEIEELRQLVTSPSRAPF
jgi:hypothetical protein